MLLIRLTIAVAALDGFIDKEMIYKILKMKIKFWCKITPLRTTETFNKNHVKKKV